MSHLVVRLDDNAAELWLNVLRTRNSCKVDTAKVIETLESFTHEPTLAYNMLMNAMWASHKQACVEFATYLMEHTNDMPKGE